MINLESTEYFEFTGEYEKTFYDIKLKNGLEVKCCWPNAGEFFSPNGIRFPGSDVQLIKVTADKDNKWK